MLAVVLISGITLKLIIRKKRKELDGFHGYVREEGDEEEGISEDWKSI
jgi:hypothetical protein